MLQKTCCPIEKWLSSFRLTANLLLVVWLLLLGGLLAGCNASAANPEPEQAAKTGADYTGKKILWVDSYHQGYEWSDGVEAGLRSVLENSGAEFKTVRLDTKNNPGDDFGVKAGLTAKAEIESFEPDVVIASDDNAQKYLIVPYYKDTAMPVIFAGVNWDASMYAYPARNVTGMVEVELPAQLVEHLKNYAEGKKVGYLTVDSETERKVVDVYNDRFFNGEMRVEYVKTWAEFKEAFVNLQQEADIVFLGNNAGIDQWNEPEVEKFFLDNTQIPTGTINPWLSPYALITLAKRPEEQGVWAAQAALDVLDGVAISDIPVAENKDGNLILNFDLGEKLDIVFSPSLLKNAEIYRSQESKP